MTTIPLLKYHSLGNDFLVALDPYALAVLSGEGQVDAGMVRALCDRRRGVGADGLILGWPSRRSSDPLGAGDVRMELRNSDGSPAETSGNGLRCLALALVHEGLVETNTITIEGGAGLVTAEVADSADSPCADVTVTMGKATVGKPSRPAPWLGEAFEAREVDTGNPHLVLLGDSIDGIDMGELGPAIETSRPERTNVEAVSPDGSGGLDLIVWERGAGLTEACGSGSCAAAAAARAAGAVGGSVPVHNPGGTLTVMLSGPLESPAMSLAGPVCRIGRVEAEIGDAREPAGVGAETERAR